MAPSDYPSRFRAAGYLLGLSLGGFFDGILLHQILQWHHLLAGLQGEGWQDLRLQILADGLFHALMYVAAAIGLVLLWRARDDLQGERADRVLAGHVLLGFGLWHVADTVLSHWVTGIHRVRMDSPNPLMWDLIWFFAFGIIPLAAGWVMRRSATVTGIAHGPIAGILLAIAVSGAGALSALPPPDLSQSVVYFPPGTTPEQVFAAAAKVDARIVWVDPSGELWVFDFADVSRAKSLYRHGALFVGNSLLPVGCISRSRAS